MNEPIQQNKEDLEKIKVAAKALIEAMDFCSFYTALSAGGLSEEDSDRIDEAQQALRMLVNG